MVSNVSKIFPSLAIYSIGETLEERGKERQWGGREGGRGRKREGKEGGE